MCRAQDQDFRVSAGGLEPQGGRFQWSPLMDAVNDSQWNRAWDLAESGTPENICCVAPLDHRLPGYTVLHLAAFNSDRWRPRWVPQFYEVICTKGRAILDARNGRGLAPLHIACSVGTVEMAEALLAAGASAPYLYRQS